MRRTALTWALALALLLALPPRLFAGPEVVASIAPVHSLVARVMQGAGRPHLLLPPGASPHHHALRPSDAAALERAALVFWVGPRLERWLTRSLTTLAAGARVVRLADAPGLTRLALRQGAVFAAHEHASEPDHDEAEIDPHLWLDPDNAKLWLDAIAAALAGADPARRALYLANAEAARAELDALAAEIEVRLAPVRGRPFVVLHDSFQYFERRFGIEAAGAVAPGDGRAPGPARIARIRDRIRALGPVCLFREPQLRSALAATVAAGAGARIALLDPLGAGLPPGPDLYPDLLRGLADSLADCLG
ncbi:MAG: zinc ABC transporter substrate-binding protein [Proteobacteria bacterium]|nr:zinc ABC transporter substrate-binding protein [Pseudomonadota bacterium]